MSEDESAVVLRNAGGYVHYVTSQKISLLNLC